MRRMRRQNYPPHQDWIADWIALLRPMLRLRFWLGVILLTGAVTFIGSVPVSLAQGGDDPNKSTIHVVQRGETLFTIAQQYGATVDAIAQANGITDVTLIKVGQRLLIPGVAANSERGVPTQVLVQPGDSLYTLSLRYGTTIDSIVRRNKLLSPKQVYVGLTLDILQASSNTPPIPTGWVHTVTPTDTWQRIAARYGLSVAQLRKQNEIPLNGMLYVGQRLLIRGDANAPALPELPDPFVTIQLVPAQVIQGKTMVLQIKTSMPVGVTGLFMGNPLVVITERDRVTHHVVFGIEALAQPGVYPMELVAIADSGVQYRFGQLVKVQDGGYAFEQLILAPELADLINPVVTQPELDRINALVRNFTPQRYFAGPMGLPCSAAMTSPYGTRRNYNNGGLNSVHTGADFAGAPGSPIIAPAAGVVVLAEALTVRGNATIIDHGWGVYTGYWHQDTISVKVGDVVQPGQVIGTVGKTGRVTGYHLHWELFVHGVAVDPLQWVQQSFS